MAVKTKKRLTKAQKRVAIAKDVLKHLETTKVATGNYLKVNFPRDYQIERADELQKHLPVVRKTCEVCALGACLVSHVSLYDAVKVGQLGLDTFFVAPSINPWREEVEAVLLRHFSEKQLALIECAFEKEDVAESLAIDEEECAVKFGKRYGRPKTRLRAIMQNIIRNKGTFVPV